MQAAQQDSAEVSAHKGAGASALSRKEGRAFAAGWAAAVVCALLVEAGRLRTRLLAGPTPGDWFEQPALDGGWPLVLLLFAPFCWAFIWTPSSHRSTGAPSTVSLPTAFLHGSGGAIASCLIVAFVAGVALSFTGARPLMNWPGPARLVDVGPVVHDEFSYLLQARTFLAGRWWWPGPDRAPELFHEMHVLNEGRVASRYFPGAGLWLAPWVSMGLSGWGSRTAMMAAAAGTCLLGRMLAGPGVGLIAGLLVALASNVAVFGNLHLAHAPTLLGAVLFWIGMAQLQRGGGARFAWLAGAGLTGAMLCRPWTAAALGLPWGVWCLMEIWRRRSEVAHTGWLISGLAIPLAAGLILVAWQNAVISGDWRRTPYSVYTETYTPRHVFGFGNGVASSASSAANTRTLLADYDRWAKNLDVTLALQNLRTRWVQSAKWSLGLPACAFACVTALLRWPRLPEGMRWLLLSGISLHLAHLPYWFAGMLGHHYVFEATPILLLVTAEATLAAVREASGRGAWLFPVWMLLFAVATAAPNHVSLTGSRSRIDEGVAVVTAPGARVARFEQVLRSSPPRLPALVLISAQADDLHSEYVRNAPNFHRALLVGQARGTAPHSETLSLAADAFPERWIYEFNTRSGAMMLIQAPRDAPLEAVP